MTLIDTLIRSWKGHSKIELSSTSHSFTGRWTTVGIFSELSRAGGGIFQTQGVTNHNRMLSNSQLQSKSQLQEYIAYHG